MTDIGDWKQKSWVKYVSVLSALLAKKFWPGHNHAHGQRPDKLTLVCYDPFAFKQERWKNKKLKEEEINSNCKTSFWIFLFHK